MSAFEELGVMPEIINSLEDMDWQLPTPVQVEAIPLILGGGDVAVAAETGAGKTGAFCLPIVQIVYETRNTNLTKSISAASTEDSQRPIGLSSLDRGRLVAVNDARTIAQSRHPVIWEGVRASHGVASGKWYYVACMKDDGLCRVGWSSPHAHLNLGTDQRGFGYGGTAMKSHRGKFDSYGESYSKGDLVCCMLDFTQKNSPGEEMATISFMKNNHQLGTAFSISRKALGILNVRLHPSVALKNAEIEVIFTRRCIKAEELGFRPICEATKEDEEPSSEISELFSKASAKGDDIDMTDATTEAIGEKGNTPLALILEPSRELAGQVEEELKKFSKFFEKGTVRHLLLTGGGNPKAEKAALSAGRDIVSGTLGSIVRHVKQGSLSLDNIRFFVLDEADLFATDNLKDVLFLHQKIPTRNRVQTLLFSATLHSAEIKTLSEKIQSFPTWVDLKGKEAVPETVHHTMVILDADADIGLIESIPKSVNVPLDMVHMEGKSKPIGGANDNAEAMADDMADVRSLSMKKLKLAALRKVIDAHEMSQAMLFVRTQQDADNLESFLIQCSGVNAAEVNTRRFKGRRDTGPEVQYSCSVLHGGRRQHARNEALAAFKAGEVRFLICTDVAARGIDVVGLPFLVNLSLPDRSENYIHRVGRVGRAERLGLAISLVSAQKEAVWYHTCNKAKGGICKNRKLVGVGGCVMWQNESKSLIEIEDRLKGRIEQLGEDFRRKDAKAAPRIYGSRVGEEEVSIETAKHIEQLQPAVRRLVELEEKSQVLFFSFLQEYPLAL